MIPQHDDDDEPIRSNWGISNYPAHIPIGLPLPPPPEPDRPDSEWVL